MKEYIVKLPDRMDSDDLCEAIRQFILKSEYSNDEDERRFFVRKNEIDYIKWNVFEQAWDYVVNKENEI